MYELQALSEETTVPDPQLLPSLLYTLTVWLKAASAALIAVAEAVAAHVAAATGPQSATSAAARRRFLFMTKWVLITGDKTKCIKEEQRQKDR